MTLLIIYQFDRLCIDHSYCWIRFFLVKLWIFCFKFSSTGWGYQLPDPAQDRQTTWLLPLYCDENTWMQTFEPLVKLGLNPKQSCSTRMTLPLLYLFFMEVPWQQFSVMGSSSGVRQRYWTSSLAFQSQSSSRVTLMDHWSWGAGLETLQQLSFPRELWPICWQLCAKTERVSVANRISRYNFIFNNYQQLELNKSRVGGLVSVGLRVYCSQQQIYMFDKQKLKELQQRSHTRGLLSKEFFYNQKQELERKRREMKSELDRQVEERRRIKEQEKMQNERRLRLEEDQIKNYYKNIESREKRPSGNQSSAQKNMKNSIAPYQTYPNDSQYQSGVKLTSKDKGRGSKPFIPLEADIPLMPDYAPNQFSSQPSQTIMNSKVNSHFVNSGNIPLLDLSEEQNIVAAAKTKKGKQRTKRQRTLQTQKEAQTQKIQQSRPQIPQAIQLVSNQRLGPATNERKSTIPDEQTIVGSLVRAGNSLQKRNNQTEQIQQQIEEIEHQNHTLKMQLKKSQEAVSLLMGAVRSNGKLDKYRMQAQKILTGNLQGSIVSRKEEEAKQDNALMLPKINLRNQSIMHDYIISAALRAKKGINK